MSRMMAAYEVQIKPDGSADLAGTGSDLDRLAAVLHWYINEAGVRAELLVREEAGAQWEAFRVEITPDDTAGGHELICALDQEFRESGNYHCSRRWVRGRTWGWLVSHLPGKPWFKGPVEP
jgi:hypothetical protein